MYYIIWNEIFSFFPDRFEMYISVAWFWILHIIMWKWVWCDTVRRSVAPHHILYNWELLFGVRSCAIGVNLCSFFQFSFRKFYFIRIFMNTKSMGTTRHCSLVTSTPSQSTELVWVCVALGLSSICVLFTNFLMNFYFITIIRNAKSVGTTRHCSLVSSTPSQSIGLVFGCALFWCSVSFVFL